ncbi:LysR family transcriptional regulator [Solicola gregarius]|uniref:LysR family transcriptional regulator n=1 Tax=Solicola gregarius TaxID=2908642 RepID=A0AA46TLD2_9ACTN|nr:LysR family transcriptional regulator [Solicola gregarius]UYM07390.1 LysR family transcriptional regulator [Solicola gregarius]
MLDVNRLRVLVAVAREGSVTAAAEALHYAQPSVSHHLARLEAEVGVPLVQRVGRGVRLTEAGRLLVERAEEILGRLDAAHAELDAYAGLRAGGVRLAAFPSALATLVPAAVARFAADHPDVRVELIEAEPPESVHGLRAGDIDLALVFEHDGDDADLRGTSAVTVLEEPMYAVTAADDDRPGDRGDLATYADDRWIAGCERCRRHLLARSALAGFEPAIGFETDDYVAVQALVAAGIGVSTLPGLALLGHRHPGVRVDRLRDDRRSVHAVTFGAPPPPLAVQRFLEVLRDGLETPAWP